jgi:hypothetical protein
VIWYKASKVSVNNTYSRHLSNGFISFDGSTSVDKSAVAIDINVGQKRALIVDTHLCWSKCADSPADVITGKSWQRDAQARELVSWIAGLGQNSIVLAGDFDMTPEFPQYPIFADYIDAWKLGLQLGTAAAPWADRDGDGVPDMPLGEVTTRTHDTRRIDYVFLQGSVGLLSIELPDLRQPCTLVNNQCSAGPTTLGNHRRSRSETERSQLGKSDRCSLLDRCNGPTWKICEAAHDRGTRVFNSSARCNSCVL